MSRGPSRERAVRRLLEMDGWLVVKAGGSLGAADLIAVRKVVHDWKEEHNLVYIGTQCLLVQVKGTQAVSKATGRKFGPFSDFGPKERMELLEAAEKAGGRAVLVWWPPYRDPEWIYSEDWPESKLRMEEAA